MRIFSFTKRQTLAMVLVLAVGWYVLTEIVALSRDRYDLLIGHERIIDTGEG